MSSPILSILVHEDKQVTVTLPEVEFGEFAGWMGTAMFYIANNQGLEIPEMMHYITSAAIAKEAEFASEVPEEISPAPRRLLEDPDEEEYLDGTVL